MPKRKRKKTGSAVYTPFLREGGGGKHGDHFLALRGGSKKGRRSVLSSSKRMGGKPKNVRSSSRSGEKKGKREGIFPFWEKKGIAAFPPGPL